MQVTLDIKSDKASFILETLRAIKGVKVVSVKDEKASYLKELADAYEQTKLAEQGKVKLKTFDELLNEV